MKPISKNLREGVKGQRVEPLASEAASKPKAKKGSIGRVYHRVFLDSGKAHHFVLFRGVRYLLINKLPKKLVSKKPLDNNL